MPVDENGDIAGSAANPVRVDPTGTTTQPVSAASLPLPTGAATSANQTTANASLSSIDTKAVQQRTADYDTGGGTVNTNYVGIALPASGGPVAGGTATNPVRTDPTGTTTQPVSGTVTANAGTGNFTVVQGTGTNLHVICDSGCGGSGGTSAADNSAFMGGTDQRHADGRALRHHAAYHHGWEAWAPRSWTPAAD